MSLGCQSATSSRLKLKLQPGASCWRSTCVSVRLAQHRLIVISLPLTHATSHLPPVATPRVDGYLCRWYMINDGTLHLNCEGRMDEDLEDNPSIEEGEGGWAEICRAFSSPPELLPLTCHPPLHLMPARKWKSLLDMVQHGRKFAGVAMVCGGLIWSQED